MQINWEWSWQYNACNFLGICPFGILLFPFGGVWYGVAIQIVGLVGSRVFCARDLARMDRECEQALAVKWGGLARSIESKFN